eukprot:gene7323-8527_t
MRCLTLLRHLYLKENTFIRRPIARTPIPMGYMTSRVHMTPHYRTFFVHKLTNLHSLDGLKITQQESEDAAQLFSNYFVIPKAMSSTPINQNKGIT